MTATLTQGLALLAALGGVYLLLGLAWTLIIGGALIFGASVLIEMLRARADARAPAHTPGRAPARARGVE